VTFDWTIDVTEDVYEDDFSVFGQITVQNPNPEDDLTVQLSDVLNDGTVASITGCSDTGVTWDGTNLYIPAGTTAVCDYTASPDGGPGLSNFADTLPDDVQFEVTYPVAGGEAYFPTVTVSGGTVLDGTYDGWCLDTNNVIYQNTTYTGDVYSSYEDLTGKVDHPENMDLVNWIINQGFVGTASSGCGGIYTYGDVQRAIWELVEDTPSTSGLSSWSQCRVNEIKAAAYANGEGFEPDCNDYIAVVLEPVNGAQIIAIAQVTLIEVGLECPVENTATATFGDLTFSASSEIDWSYTVEDDQATLDDDQFPYNGEEVYDGWTTTYTDSDDFTCSTVLDDYIDGADLGNMVENTAIVFSQSGEEDRDTATTYIDCYIPSISKTAAGTYDERHEWDVEKDVDPYDQSGYPGDVLAWTWTIDVFEDIYEENFDVAGTITVENPNPEDALVVPLSDALSDGTVVVIDQASCAFDGTNLTVAAGGSETCSYEANDLGYTALAEVPGSNKATITLNGIDFEAIDPIEYTANVIRGTATLSDIEIGLAAVSVSGGDQFTGSDQVVCSTVAGTYGAAGSYGATITNLATLTDSERNTYTDDATTSWLCEAGFVDLLKLTDGVVNPDKDWQFALYVGPDGFDGTQVRSTSSALGDTDGVLEFGNPALRPDTTYTVCELGVPAGWSSFWRVDVDGDGVYDATVNPSNPNADDDPPEDLGNRCIDFGAGTTIPVTVGTKIRFEVDNTYPGGAPRTPGYWKNWNRCTNGGQQYTADANGGWEEGYWLLEDVLDPDIGGGIVWNDILDDGFLFPITSCEDAVLILDKRDLNGKKKASDPLHNLATHLLAAQLNFGAGACTTEEVLDKVLEAETLLDKYNFDGYGHDKLNKKDPDAEAANKLADYLDRYNNGEFCGNGGE
jgi:hypothetical protein